MDSVEVRKATREEAPFIARNILASLQLPVFEDSLTPALHRMLATASELCARDDTQVSWKNTLVACINGVPAGSLTCYDGSRYREWKENSLRYTREISGEVLDDFADETGPGEYYLDSLAVLPSFRGRGLGRLLIGQALSTAEALGFEKATLLVLKKEERLQEIYIHTGFSPCGELTIFGEEYVKMEQPLR